VLVHTGQHYDESMSGVFLTQLGLPTPRHSLGVGSGSHAAQTAGIMVAYEQLCARERPDFTVVVGDVNSTLACALVCVKALIPVGHLEAGLRSRDRSMPEEINRIVTDALADLLWTPSEDGDRNLLQEGIAAERIECVGNIMIDCFELQRRAIEAAGKARELGRKPKSYGVVTLHRPANVDDAAQLRALIEAMNRVSQQVPLIFPMHPRTLARLRSHGLHDRAAPTLTLTGPLDYVSFMSLVSDALVVITDSGGVQEETTYLDIPCLTLRANTERPVTVTHGTNELIDLAGLAGAVTRIRAGHWKHAQKIPLWDGHAAERVAESLDRWRTARRRDSD
jgi:UDP-N-acetylglucosamine 2-epimerase (non-hydrolysing)